MNEFRAWALLIGVPALLAGLFLWLAPPRHNPFAAVDLREPIGLGTWHKLTRAKKNPELCFGALDQAGIIYSALGDSPPGTQCPVKNALLLDRSLTPYSASLKMTCAQMAALYTWERHIARPAAMEILGSPVKRIETYGTFSCRNIAGTSRLSEHASANAIDISGFLLEDGRVISIAKHWRNGGKEGKFLRRAHKGGCRIFSVVLGPDYNKAHADHFHFDMGSGHSCR